MNYSNYIGWDIGGAHLKIASVSDTGKINFIEQHATPLWKGFDKLSEVLPEVVKRIPRGELLHAVTMTAELVDIFENRQLGINALTDLCKEHLSGKINLYASEKGFIMPDSADKESANIASANWHASALITASIVDSGLFIDIGSTTTDIIPFREKKLINSGFDDQSRMRCDELVYTGVIRTPLMSLTQKVPFAGEWQTIAAEHFSTTADVYRILGLLNENDDLMDSADGTAKNIDNSIKRLARMVGKDVSISYSPDIWYKLAEYFAEIQLQLLTNAVLRVMSRTPDKNIKIIGAGAGRFLVRNIAERLNCTYVEFSELFDCVKQLQHMCNVCAPAVALAQLNRINALK